MKPAAKTNRPESNPHGPSRKARVLAKEPSLLERIEALNFTAFERDRLKAELAVARRSGMEELARFIYWDSIKDLNTHRAFFEALEKFNIDPCLAKPKYEARSGQTPA